MRVDELIGTLDGVRASGSSKWTSKCPSHPDRSPSLSIREVKGGRILVHCFAGCSVEQITGALGLKISDLFADVRPTLRRRRTPKAVRLDGGALGFRYELGACDLRIRAKSILDAAKDLDISLLKDEELDKALRHVGQAYADLKQAKLLEDVADDLRTRAWRERTSREQRTQAA